MPGFAEEVAASKTQPLPAGNGQEQPVVEGTQDFAIETQQSAAPVEKPKETVAAAPAATEPEAPKAKIRIGTREFNTPEEAYAYAQELEVARAEDKGFIEGVKSQAKPDPVEPEKQFEDILEETFFENPKKAFKLFQDKIKETLDKDLTEKDQRRQEQEALAQVRDATWNKFYQDNADLLDYQELISGKGNAGGPLLQQWWNEVSNKPTAEAMQLIADKARNALKIQKSKAAVVEELPNATATSVTPGGNSSQKVTGKPENNSDEPLDFISQVRKHGKRQ